MPDFSIQRYLNDKYVASYPHTKLFINTKNLKSIDIKCDCMNFATNYKVANANNKSCLATVDTNNHLTSLAASG